MSISFDKFEEHIFLNTVLIENVDDKECGTGFIVRKFMEGGKNMKVLLFSNKHVFWGKKDIHKAVVSKHLKITLHKREDDGSYKIGTTHTFNVDISRQVEGYYENPSDQIDVACVNISAAFNLKPLHVSPLDLERYLDYKLEDISCGTQIYFVGYPSGFYDTAHYLPVMRTGTIASIPKVDFNGKKQILVDAQVFPGSSGSPVFFSYQEKYKLLGIISDGIYKGINSVEVALTNEPKLTKSVPIEWLGLGLVFKSETIQEAFDMA